jgi:hypothetical protein
MTLKKEKRKKVHCSIMTIEMMINIDLCVFFFFFFTLIGTKVYSKQAWGNLPNLFGPH